ncbi:hypothetical protein DRQ26_02185, partial [bacterium]
TLLSDVINYCENILKNRKIRKYYIGNTGIMHLADAILYYYEENPEKFSNQEMLDLCDVIIKELGDALFDNTELCHKVHFQRAKALVSLSREKDAIFDAYVSYEMGGDSIDADLLSSIAGEPADSVVKKLRKKYSNIFPKIPKNFQLLTMDGDTLRYEDIKGKIVILNFWGTGCKPCVKEFPTMAKISDWAEKNGVIFLAITSNGDSRENVNRILEQVDPGYTICWDIDNKLFSALNITGIPQHLIVDKNGLIRKRTIGSISEPDKLLKNVAEILNAQRQRLI